MVYHKENSFVDRCSDPIWILYTNKGTVCMLFWEGKSTKRDF